MDVFKNFDKDTGLSWVFAILIGIGFEVLLIMILPPSSPHLWIKWAALPIVYGAQRLIFNEMKNPTKFDGQEDG